MSKEFKDIIVGSFIGSSIALMLMFSLFYSFF
ncbi:Uncharacterised protein [Mannheimia haemolytica]|nr:Uncharacterised protein [Mannheimia haemolytica]